MSKYIKDYAKMQVMREFAKKYPEGQINDVIKMIDKEWDEAIKIMKKEIESEKPPRFITKF